MREKELRQHATCGCCQRPIGEAGVPLFWRVTIERHGLDLGALRRQNALAMMLGGNAAIAHAMGPDEEMTTPVMEPVVISVCERCALMSGQPLAIMAETWLPIKEAP